MKKLFIMMIALMTVALFASPSFAINKVQMTLTSPTIYKAGCEKIGSTTYSFDGGSSITAGDWWYMDLPENVTLCKNYDYVILGVDVGGLANPNVHINATATNRYTRVAFNNGDVINAAAVTANGPLFTAGLTPGMGLAGNMAFLVKGTSGSRRITIYTLSNTGGASTLTSVAGGTIQFKLFDGKAWNDTTTLALDETRIVLDRDGDGTYGELAANVTGSSLDEVIGGNAAANVTTGEPYVENTLCANAEGMSGQYLYTSYSSRSDKFTFSGDSQIAHTAAAGAIALVACKGETSFDIEMDSSQSAAACWFEYEVAVAVNGNYCSADWPALGQRFLIEASSGAFGDIDDKYSISASITSPSDGVYFGGAPAVTLIKSSEDECAVAGAASGALFTAYEGSTVATGYAPTTCTINTGYRVDSVVGTSASVFKLDGYDTIFVDFGRFAYGNTMVVAGEEVTVELTLDRYPCGTIFTGSRTIGTFVTSCTTASSTTLRFPWLPGTAATGWWGGFVITNFGTNDGTAALIYRDSAGKTATYTTPTVVANGMWDNSNTSASDLTDVDGYDGSLNFSVNATCAFTAKGFAFTANGKEGVGYSVDN